MPHKLEEKASEHINDLDRRTFLQATGFFAATALGTGLSLPAFAKEPGGKSGKALVSGRRKLGKLEVSAIGLGCQDMTGTFYSTAPRRADMITLIRTAYDRGVTFFDAAEAYGPHEVERILGEGVVPFRNQVVITSKFGWDIDLETGRFRGGLNSRPEHIRLAVEGMLKRFKTDRIDLLYQHRVEAPGDLGSHHPFGVLRWLGQRDGSGESGRTGVRPSPDLCGTASSSDGSPLGRG